MKKLLLGLAIASLSIPSAFALENQGVSQLIGLSPAPGNTERFDLTEGIYAINFKLTAKSGPNRNADKYACLMHNDQVLAVVPSSNTKQMSYDGIYADVWQLYFYLNGNPVQEAGDYQIVIDEGYFLMGEAQTPSEKIVLNYELNPMQFELDPPAGIIESVDEIKITFPAAKYIKHDATKTVEFFDLFSKGETTLSYKLDVEVDEGTNTATFYFDKAVSMPTTWKLAAPEGLFTLYDENGKETPSEMLSESYIIENFLNGKPVPDPAPGEITEFPGVITLTIPEGAKVQVVNDKVSVYIYPLLEDGSRGKSIARLRASKSKDNDRQILLTNFAGADQAIKPAPGRYQLGINERLYRIDSDTKYCNALSYDYTVISSGINYTVTPDNSTAQESLQSFTVTFPEATSLELGNGLASYMTQSLPYVNYLYYAKKVDDKSIQFITSAPASFKGDYIFTSAENQIVLNGQPISIKVPFTLGETSGVNAVENQLPESFDIYSIDGRLVKAAATAEDLNLLPAGLYISGGKKILVK